MISRKISNTVRSNWYSYLDLGTSKQQEQEGDDGDDDGDDGVCVGESPITWSVRSFPTRFYLSTSRRPCRAWAETSICREPKLRRLHQVEKRVLVIVISLAAPTDRRR